jgi:beta-galactosidase
MNIGVDYYPEHWDESRWPVDAKLMREAGITFVRLAEFSWCKLEPTEGNYDFSWLDRALAVLHKEGIKSVLGTPTATPPAWLHERYPEIYPADAKKYRLGFGTRLQRCLNNEDMRRYSRLITETMAKHYAKNPAVAGWQTDNEFEGNLCYCETCAAKFREWLREKYGSLEALNEAWGTIFWSQEYSGWSQIPLPWEVKCGKSHNPSLQLDYRRFASESTVSFQHEQVEILRANAPEQFITHNMMGLHDSVDYFELGKDLDFVSWDNYPAGFWIQGEPTRSDLAHDVIRGIKGRNFWVMEEQSGITGWETMSRRPVPGQIRLWSWQAIAQGADLVQYFRWRSCLFGTEQYWHGILNHDGVPRRRYREIKGFSEELASLSAELDGSSPENSVAILNSYEQNWAFQIQPQAKGLLWWDQVRRYHDALGRAGVGTDVVPMGADLSKYRLVILPGWYLLRERDAEKLGAYVKAGGVLVVSARTGVKNELNTCRTEPLPGPIADLAGVEVDDYDPLGDATCPVTLADGTSLSASVWADALVPKGAETVASYAGGCFPGEAAVTRNETGKGSCWYFGTAGDAAFYDSLLSRVLEDSSIEPYRGLPPNVAAKYRVRNGATWLFLLNLGSAEASVPVHKGAKHLLGPEAEGDTVRLPAYGVAIYRI